MSTRVPAQSHSVVFFTQPPLPIYKLEKRGERKGGEGKEVLTVSEEREWGRE
jgi:hypothetical protein